MQASPYFKFEINIKRFKKLKRINKGGFGVVYSVEEKETNEIYAAKIIDCNDDEEQSRQMINREIAIMMTVNHPTIIKFYGYSLKDFQDEFNITILMQFAKNGSLDFVLKNIQNSNGPKYYNNTIRQIILIGISRAMKYLHDRNIIHRDLKTGNVLLDEDFHPLVSDFGFSKMFDVGHSNSQSQFGGTLPYLAPEIITGNNYNRKVDVYSFAIIMFEVVTDLVPYPILVKEKVTDFEFKRQIVTNNLRPEFSVPIKQSFRDLIEKCWSKDPNDRPTFKEIFEKLTNENGEFFLEGIDENEVKQYIEEITEITDPIEDLIIKNDLLNQENCQLKAEICNLKDENSRIKDLEKDNESLKIQIDKLKKEMQLMNKQNENELNLQLPQKDSEFPSQLNASEKAQEVILQTSANEVNTPQTDQTDKIIDESKLPVTTDENDQNNCENTSHSDIKVYDEYVKKMKNVYVNILDYIENEKRPIDDINKLIQFLNDQGISNNAIELKEIFQIIVAIADNHHRSTNFLGKITIIILYFKDSISKFFSNMEIFHLFNSSKNLMLYLFDQKILTMTKDIANTLIEHQYYNSFFYFPEMKDFLSFEKKKESQREINRNCKNFTEFKKMRLIGENENIGCEEIRKDSLNEFLKICPKLNLNDSVGRSRLETNNYLFGYDQSYTEYAAFFGSSKILEYLMSQKMDKDTSLESLLFGNKRCPSWVTSVHGNNQEVFAIYEKLNNETNSQNEVLQESITCHHNKLANFFIDKYFQNKSINELILECSLKSHNYEFFPNIINDETFYFMCKYNYISIVKILLDLKIPNINKEIIYF